MASRRVLDPAPDEIYVLDSCLLIRIKRIVKVDDQWPLLAAMLDLVRSGSLCFPRQVATEVADQRWPDAPGAWVGHAKDHVCHREPADGCVSQVLAAAADLIDADATGPEPADPYVAAMALQLKSVYANTRVVVASDDKVDRLPLKLSLKTACDRLGIEFCEPEPFLAWLRGRINGESPAES
jgi:Domain of unknown function (DUF4411)